MSTSVAGIKSLEETQLGHAIIIGTGLAGLSAASTLLSLLPQAQAVAQNQNRDQSQPRILILDLSPKPGGNSIKASSGINGAPTPFQPPQDPADSTTLFMADTIRSAGVAFANASPEEKKWRKGLIRALVDDSGGAVEWLASKGVDLRRVTRLGGHSAARTHRPEGGAPPGWAIVNTLLKEIKGDERVNLDGGRRVTGFLTGEDGGVVGVKYLCTTPVKSSGGAEKEEGEKEHHAFGPVIVASGGFAGSLPTESPPTLLSKHRPDLAGLPSTNEPRPGAGVLSLLMSAGAAAIDIESVQVHPTSFVDPSAPFAFSKILGGELLRGGGGVLLRGETGERFVNEMDTREGVSAGIMKGPMIAESTGTEASGEGVQCTRQWDVTLVLDSGAYTASKTHVDFYVSRGLMRRTTLSSLPAGAISTLREYSLAATGGGPDVYGRRSFGSWSLKPEDVTAETEIWVGKVTPAVHFTMGGVMIDDPLGCWGRAMMWERRYWVVFGRLGRSRGVCMETIGSEGMGCLRVLVLGGGLGGASLIFWWEETGEIEFVMDWHIQQQQAWTESLNVVIIGILSS